jgi:hypothetical protein
MTHEDGLSSEPENRSAQEVSQRALDAPPGDVPNEEAAEREFPHTEASSLREAGDLTDDDGDDIRQYSGEPVPTEHGQVIPQQMAVGRETTIGDGEWPDAPPRGDVAHDEAGGGDRDDGDRDDAGRGDGGVERDA